MARTYNQKIKILYLMQMFLNETDEEHSLSQEGLGGKAWGRGHKHRTQEPLQ